MHELKTNMNRKQKKALRLVSQYTGSSEDDLLYSTRGSRESARARQLLMFVLHSILGMSFTEIGSSLGRYRKTVSHGYNLIRARLPENQSLRSAVRDMERKLM